MMRDLIRRESHDTAFASFLQSQTAGGVVLLVVSVIAFILANGPLWEVYDNFAHMHASVQIGQWDLDLDLSHWVNEGVMVFFFFLVGLEIKREILVGELSEPRKAALAVIAAAGGMIAPALIFTLFNIISPDTLRGWGIPMATDIAFVIGVLSVLGNRVPVALKVFLTGLAIVDDLGAIVVIALFYTENFMVMNLLISLTFVFASWMYGKKGGANGVVFSLFALGCWYFILESGIHSTIAGVLMAFTIPIRQKYELDELNHQFRMSFLDGDFEIKEHHLDPLERIIRKSESPLERFEHKLQPWVAFLIVPLFAFFNAGVHLSTHFGFGLFMKPHVLGIFFGLLLGKPLGILFVSTIAVKRGWATLPDGVNWRAMIGVGFLAGLGFTMSLFISVLAFPEGSPTLQEAKLGILLASLTAMLIGAPLTYRALAPQATDN
ncbi:MAG: Na+/H+ antiporter NhaA [Kiritimatiellae bacterium]|nr:Na+/H+ antiporter NhaA [Kiritimatiellia bacterium]